MIFLLLNVSISTMITNINIDQMMKKTLIRGCLLCLLTVSYSVFSAVILQYHHVSETTPKSTSISPTQFEKHLTYLAEHNFKVVPLSNIVDAIKNNAYIPDKTVAITFDDAYLNILTNAKPLLDKFNYPFTIFINPAIVSRNSPHYLSWQQLKNMADSGVIIANHGLEHNSLARISKGITNEEWVTKQVTDLLHAEKIITEKTGQNWQYFAYPYGEYNLDIQQAIVKNGFIAFGQQSGAVSKTSDLGSIPRFPASSPYDKIASLKDKLNSLPFNINISQPRTDYVIQSNEINQVSFNITLSDFNKNQLNCYVTGLGKQQVTWQNDESFTLHFSEKLPVGRVRANCTAPSIEKPGRFYWYSQPWFVLNENKEWYPL